MPSYAAVFQLWFIDFLFRYCFYLLFGEGGAAVMHAGEHACGHP